jgi:hypothetical protein
VEMRLPEPGDALTGVDMFAGLEPEVRQRVIAAAVPRTYRKGQLLFVENDPGDSLIVLKRGAIAVFRTAPTGERAVLSVIRPPDVLGEVSLLDASTRSASAEAIEDCTALALSRGAFMDLVHSNAATRTRSGEHHVLARAAAVRSGRHCRAQGGGPTGAASASARPAASWRCRCTDDAVLGRPGRLRPLCSMYTRCPTPVGRRLPKPEWESALGPDRP